MTNTMIMTAAARSRALMPAAAINRARSESVHASIHAVRLTDVVPATPAGRGFYANTKQDRPPRGEPR